ncbi:toll/interleukin-1 receptor domain-containing protein [Verrucosispora sioxanthis]|uniref:Toll/interleukin-1 receptor domain-containing protein n=1 Tax=Verrucosispora sioxanthis TaxID=2499994 RepID=A0A6M1KQZ7_9ACTN|nr:toll/interleukin-1 receptor domain-containing protein [Verrucosispora sioxanthis]NEE63288.1 toll/interleukin-1 receptor domain-containing protein [Verrucosispora sioxanthis]NGM12398.1 toll/interleukin-1 receptor domain-containing protein [Verrucosispora sioxanthis]
MEASGLIVAIISAIAGIAAAWFGYLAVRDKLRHRHTAPAAVQPPTNQPYDAFISYAAADEDLAEQIAHHLQTRNLRVFLAKWIDLGLVKHLEKECALNGTRTGILLFSAATMTQPEIRDDYAAILQRAHNGGRRFIPVLVEQVDLPPYAKIRQPLDLTDKRNRDTNLDTLARTIQRA